MARPRSRSRPRSELKEKLMEGGARVTDVSVAPFRGGRRRGGGDDVSLYYFFVS